eukprot:1593819-Prymnesium_polylepis.1
MNRFFPCSGMRSRAERGAKINSHHFPRGVNTLFSRQGGSPQITRLSKYPISVWPRETHGACGAALTNALRRESPPVRYDPGNFIRPKRHKRSTADMRDGDQDQHRGLVTGSMAYGLRVTENQGL